MTEIEQMVPEIVDLEREGQWAKAVLLYEKQLVNEMPVGERVLTLARLVQALREDDRYDEAEQRLEEATAVTNDEVDAYATGLVLLEEGRLAEYRGDQRLALRKFEKAVQRLEPFPPAWLQAQLAIVGLERTLGELSKARERLRQIARRDSEEFSDSDRADFFGALGAIHLARGDYRAAEQTLERAVELDESQSSDYGAADNRLLLAQTYLGLGERQRAKRLIEEVTEDLRAVDDTAALSDTYPVLGRLYEESGDYVNATRFYQHGLNLDIAANDELGRARAYRRLARTYRKRGDLRRADDYLDEGRPLVRNNDVERAAFFTEQGDLALDRGEFGEAEDLFRKAKQLIEEDGDDRRTAIATRNLGRALREKGDLPAAESMLKAALPSLRSRGDLRELDDLLDDLGEVLLEQDRYDEALVFLEESLLIDQQVGAIASHARTLLLRGRAFMCLGERDKAQKALTAALKMCRQSGDEVGESTARYFLGEWLRSEGRLTEAIEQFRAGQVIDGRHNDRLGLVRAARALAAVYRRKGDVARARELLDEATRELGRFDDPAEQAHLKLEEGQLAMARGTNDEAEEHLREAQRSFDKLNSPVQTGACFRFLGKVATARGRHAQAEVWLAKAKQIFHDCRSLHELGQVLDDLGTLQLRMGMLDEAEAYARQSLDLDRSMGWLRGKGTSFLLLCEVALRREDQPMAKQFAIDALESFSDVGDEVGQSEARLLLGDYYANEDKLDEAIQEYKAARKLDMRHGDAAGLSRCHRRLGHAYLLKKEWIRAEEALDQAQDYLQGVNDPYERGSLALELGQLHAAINDHASAVSSFRQAVRLFEEVGDTHLVEHAYQGLVASHQAQGNLGDALGAMREMGVEHANVWALMVRSLDPLVVEAAEQCLLDGQYAPAIKEAYAALEQAIRKSAAAVTPPLKVDSALAPIPRVIDPWVRVHDAIEEKDQQAIAEMTKAAFSLVRNPMAHASREATPKDAFVALALAGFLAERLELAES